ncbi:hypothetical protein [Marinospirillum sp.]|uniref:hypothetical protein n=1 Tax=Marinospirillum sp. TaxID=2183934 RepID=UPI003850789B
MDEAIPVSLDRIRKMIAQIESEHFSTADVLRRYNGGFCSNHGTPAQFSFNAQFGKLLKRNAEDLGIREVEPDASIEDDHGHPTSSSIWARRA